MGGNRIFTVDATEDGIEDGTEGTTGDGTGFLVFLARGPLMAFFATKKPGCSSIFFSVVHSM